MFFRISRSFCALLLISTAYIGFYNQASAQTQTSPKIQGKASKTNSVVCPEYPCKSDSGIDEFAFGFEMSDYSFDGGSYGVAEPLEGVTVTAHRDHQTQVCTQYGCSVVNALWTTPQITDTLVAGGFFTLRDAKLVASKIKNARDRDVRCSADSIVGNMTKSTDDDQTRYFAAREIFDAYRQRGDIKTLLSMSNTAGVLYLLDDGRTVSGVQITYRDGGSDVWPVEIIDSMQLRDTPWQHLEGSPDNPTTCPLPPSPT